MKASRRRQHELRPRLHDVWGAQHLQTLHPDDDAPGLLVDLIREHTHLGDAAVLERVCLDGPMPRPSEKQCPRDAGLGGHVEVQGAIALLGEIVASRVEVEAEAAQAAGGELRGGDELPLGVARADLVDVLDPPLHGVDLLVLDDLDASLEPVEVLLAGVAHEELPKGGLDSGDLRLLALHHLAKGLHLLLH
eukprot:CAMPEP_0176296208 /NCGR_PEP_ID=MMETSP0121_2-20121125/58076_1 /TAXON_ID=160619 /ORGANISM="Kryptoperidinium foliaceum, Strain CCMP 1326" /LENGTH=191 /DNA_ID=CAMNT_0017637335 /DNA_START=63 /DNA_END=635 /DNA_ORIENTATION=+